MRCSPGGHFSSQTSVMVMTKEMGWLWRISREVWHQLKIQRLRKVLTEEADEISSTFLDLGPSQQTGACGLHVGASYIAAALFVI